MASLIITNANIVNEGEIIASDILIKNQRIEFIGDCSGRNADKVIDAAGRFLLPGMIDNQVHFREPGFEHKADIATESRAAIAGGVTSFLDTPNNQPNVLTLDTLNHKAAIASRHSLANYGFYLGASNDNLEVIKALDSSTVCGVKIFMGASTEGMLVDDPEVLENIFQHSPVLVATHCEDTPTILENEESYRGIYGDQIPMSLHAKIRSDDACFLSSSFAVDLAKQFDTRLHVLHVSTAKELTLFSDETLADKKITADVCAHYLNFCEDDYADKGALLKCNPAIKTEEDRAALIQGLMEGRLDIIGSDHAPHTWQEKQVESYFDIPAGIPSIQHTLVSLLESFHDGIFSLEFIVEKTSHAVADLYRIQERGYIREGYFADLVLVDIANDWQVEQTSLLSKCAWSPYLGHTFRSSIDATIVNGELLWESGKFLPSAQIYKGAPLSFGGTS